MRICEKCGAQLPDGTLFCTECGEKASEAQAAPAVETAAPAAPVAPAPDKPKREKREKPESPEDKKGPYSTFKFTWSLLLLFVPVLNIYLIFRWAFAWGVNINKRNFARGALFALLAVILLHAALFVIFPQFLSWIGALLIKCIAFLFGVHGAAI